MRYKIDHYFNEDHDEQCLLIDLDIHVSELIKILASIQFKFEEFHVEACVNEEHLLYILTKFYGAEDVKDKYKPLLQFTKIPKEEWEIVNMFYSVDIMQIDLYEAREYSCSPEYEEMMEKYLPKDDAFNDYINSLKDFYCKR